MSADGDGPITGDSPYLDPQVASAYARLAAPSQFTRPACDLVGLLDVSIGASVLDVGAGSGVVAAALAQAVGAAGRVIAVDPSAAMLCAAGPQSPYHRSRCAAAWPAVSGRGLSSRCREFRHLARCELRRWSDRDDQGLQTGRAHRRHVMGHSTPISRARCGSRSRRRLRAANV